MIAICVGHSRSGDNGAISVTGVSEFDYNLKLGNLLVDAARSAGLDFRLYSYYEGGSYGAAMGWLGDVLKEDGADAALELHFNSASPDAHGYEYLYWHSSDRGAALAECLHDAHAGLFTKAKSRGVKSRDSGDRGAGFLNNTPCPAVICEPFFGSNNEEWEFYGENIEALALVYFSGIQKFARALS